jgi:hypothetical protein
MRESISNEAPPQTLEHVWFGSASLGTVLVLPRLQRGVDVLKAVGKNLTQSQGIPAFKASRRIVSITASLLAAAPGSALACPVCALVGTSNNTWAYQAMSAMLTLLPLAMVGATVWWLTRLVARADTERRPGVEVASDSLVQGTSPTRRGSAPGGLVSVTRRASAE